MISARGGLLIGGVVLLLGIITLGLSLGVFQGSDNAVWGVVGLIAAGGFGIGYLENRQHGWMLIAAYVFLALSLIVGTWSLFGGGAGLSALVLVLIGLPFAVVYGLSKGRTWQALFAAALAFMTAQVVLFGRLIRLLAADPNVSGLLLGASFLAALALIVVALWLPNRHDPHFAWAAYPPHILIILAAFLGMLALGVPQLAIPALLLYIGAVLLIRYWLHLQQP